MSWIYKKYISNIHWIETGFKENITDSLRSNSRVKSSLSEEVKREDHYWPYFQDNLEIKEKKANMHGFNNKVFQFLRK